MKAAESGKTTVWRSEAKQNRDTSDNPEECSVCLTAFDDTQRRPRTLPCGHSLCTPCIHRLKDHGHVTCPQCRVNHVVPEGGQFPVSYTLEAFMKRLREAEAAAASSPRSAGKGVAGTAGQTGAAGLAKKVRSLVEDTVVAAIVACQDVHSQLDHYETTLTAWGDEQQQLEDTLQGLIDQSRRTRELVRQEKSRAAAKKEKVKKGERQLCFILDTLRTTSSETEAGVAVTEVFRCTDEAEQVVEECRKRFPDAHTATTVSKVRKVSNAALEAVQAVQVDFEVHPTELDPDSTIMDRLQIILPPSSPSLKVEDLRNLTQLAKELLQDGLVFAAHHIEGLCRYSRISLEANQLYLYSLKEATPPPGIATLKMSEVVPSLPPCLVFLDLAWPSSDLRRVFIRLKSDTPLGRQFMLLCTGQHGPSFANTKLFRVRNKGQPGEFVRGGDYESNDGTRGAALLPDLDKGEYLRSGRAGDVWGGWCGDPARDAQFAITTMDLHDDFVYVGVFGEVVKGLEDVAAAAKQSNIAEVTVVDCGVVLQY